MISELLLYHVWEFYAMYQFRVLSSLDEPKTSMPRTNVLFMTKQKMLTMRTSLEILHFPLTQEKSDPHSLSWVQVFWKKERICLRYLLGCHQWLLETLYLDCLPIGDHKRCRFSFIKVIKLCKKYIVGHKCWVNAFTDTLWASRYQKPKNVFKRNAKCWLIWSHNTFLYDMLVQREGWHT